MQCRICGKYSAYYPVCEKHRYGKKLVDMCRNCGEWRLKTDLTDKLCAQCSTDVKKIKVFNDDEVLSPQRGRGPIIVFNREGIITRDKKTKLINHWLLWAEFARLEVKESSAIKIIGFVSGKERKFIEMNLQNYVRNRNGQHNVGNLAVQVERIVQSLLQQYFKIPNDALRFDSKTTLDKLMKVIRPIKRYNFPDYPTFEFATIVGAKSHAQLIYDPNFIEAQKVGAKTYSELRLVRKYKAPDLTLTKEVVQWGFPNFQLYKKAEDLGLLTLRVNHINSKDILPLIKEIVQGDFPNLQTYFEALELGLSTFKELDLVKKYNVRDLETAKLIQRGGFSDFETYEKAQKIGANTLKDYLLVEKVQAPDLTTAELVVKGNFPDFQTYKEARNVDADSIEKFELVKKYKAPNYAIAKQVQAGNFPDLQTYKEARNVDADSIEKLELVREYKAPDYNIANQVQAGNFPDFETFKEAQTFGVRTFDQYELIKQYSASDYASAEKIHFDHVSQELIDEIETNGKVIFSSFSDKFTIKLGLSRSFFREVIANEDILGIYTTDWEIFLSEYYIYKQFKEITKLYADIGFSDIATSLGIPIERTPEILTAIIESNLVTGMIDRTNQRFFVRELPKSVFEKLLDGQVLTTDQIMRPNDQSIEICLRGLQKRLPSKKHVLTREKGYIKIEQINLSCQVCGTESSSEHGLACNNCGRALCWDHFEELRVAGRVMCPYCDSSFVFIPKYCEKCHIDYIRVPSSGNNCEFCGYTLKVRRHLTNLYKVFLGAQKERSSEQKRTKEEISKKAQQKDVYH